MLKLVMYNFGKDEPVNIKKMRIKKVSYAYKNIRVLSLQSLDFYQEATESPTLHELNF